MTRKNQRILMIVAGLSFLGIATALVLTAFEDSIVFFYSPSDLAEQKLDENRRIRLGGLVVEGSVQQGPGDGEFRFKLTDGGAEAEVHYVGLLPDLFREGQGIIAQGVLKANGTFNADEVLAKHDETYMPKEVADALKKQGHWQPDGDGAAKGDGGS